jgi:hypothetical protein
VVILNVGKVSMYSNSCCVNTNRLVGIGTAGWEGSDERRGRGVENSEERRGEKRRLGSGVRRRGRLRGEEGEERGYKKGVEGG